MSEYLTIADVCQKYKVSRKTVERWIATRSLPAIKMNANNGAIRIQPDVFEKWLEGQNDKSVAKRMRWSEYELKYKITSDLQESKNAETGIVIAYDDFKLQYDQDFYIKYNGQNGAKEALVNVRFYSALYATDDFRKSVAARYQQDLRLYLLEVNVNGDPVETKIQTIENVTFVVVEPNEILDFQILDLIRERPQQAG